MTREEELATSLRLQHNLDQSRNLLTSITSVTGPKEAIKGLCKQTPLPWVFKGRLLEKLTEISNRLALSHSRAVTLLRASCSSLVGIKCVLWEQMRA